MQNSINKTIKLLSLWGSQSDFKVMKEAVKILKDFKIKHEVLIVSAHRTPKRMFDFATSAEKNGFTVIIARAGMAAHFAWHNLLGNCIMYKQLPVESKKLAGLDSLLSSHMPNGIPLAVMPINGAIERWSLCSFNNCYI